MPTKKSIDKKFFAELYLKEQGIEYNDCSTQYADMGNCYSYMSVKWWDKKNEFHEELIDVIDVFNLMSKYILENSNKL
jgi:hypothetical protein